MTKLTDQVIAARKANVPLLLITTPDPASTIQAISEAINHDYPRLSWDVINGVVPLNKPGQEAMQACSLMPGDGTNPVEALTAIVGLPERSLVFAKNLTEYCGSQPVRQAIWELRDNFKADKRTLFMLAQDASLHPELAHDVIHLEEPLPDDERLKSIITDLHQENELECDEATLHGAVAATKGLAAFTAEQIVAMSFDYENKTLNIPRLRERKIDILNDIDGITVYQGTETFDQIGGLTGIKNLLQPLCTGPHAPKIVALVDEMEKDTSASDTDTSGVSQYILKKWLQAMEDYEWYGFLSIGHPGTGKSLIAKAVQATFGIMALNIDLGAMKSEFVGSSESRTRRVIETLHAMAGPDVLVIGTCNSAASIPPALLRRLTLGQWFYDLPTEEERESIWNVNRQRFAILPEQGRPPNDTNWTGADIRNCCSLAWRQNISLQDASQFLVPVAVSDPQGVARLRQVASGRWLDASNGGIYHAPTGEQEKLVGSRKMDWSSP